MLEKLCHLLTLKHKMLVSISKNAVDITVGINKLSAEKNGSVVLAFYLLKVMYIKIYSNGVAFSLKYTYFVYVLLTYRIKQIGLCMWLTGEPILHAHVRPWVPYRPFSRTPVQLNVTSHRSRKK